MLFCLQISPQILKDANVLHPPHCSIPTPMRITIEATLPALPVADIGSFKVLVALSRSFTYRKQKFKLA